MSWFEAERKKSLPDNIYKSGEIKDDGSGITIQSLGPEEEFAQNVLKSLKEKISDARETVQELEAEIEQKQQEAEQRREEILEEAREEADQIRRDAEDEAQELIETKEQKITDARDEGYEDGYDAGEEEARADMADLVEQAQQILSEAKRERDAFIDRKTETLVELAGVLAHEVVREYVEVNPEVIERIVEDALNEISEIRDVTLVLNPEDAEIIRDVKDQFREDHPNLQEITITNDPKMDRGGCRVRTSFGDIQGSVRDQIDHLSRTLVEGIESGDLENLSESSADD